MKYLLLLWITGFLILSLLFQNIAIMAQTENFTGITRNLPEEITRYEVKPSSQVPSPLKQVETGIKSLAVECSDNFVFMQKFENSKPACVSLQTAQKLAERKWGWIISVTYNGCNAV